LLKNNVTNVVFAQQSFDLDICDSSLMVYSDFVKPGKCNVKLLQIGDFRDVFVPVPRGNE
jgi:hypothetical protein